MLARIRRSPRPSRLVALLLISLIAQGAVYSRPCYQRTGGSMVCRNACNSILPIGGLSCPGGVWSVSDLRNLGKTLNDSCEPRVSYNSIPRPNHTSGNERSGYQQQGRFKFTCASIISCTRFTDPVPPIKVMCNLNRPTLCVEVKMFTAGGKECRGGGGGVGGGIGGEG